MDNERNIAKFGNVVPVKVVIHQQLHGCHGQQRAAEHQHRSGLRQRDHQDTNLVAESVSAADTTGQMRTVDGMYMYNLTTKGMVAGKDYTIRIRVGNATNRDDRPDCGAAAEEVADPTHGRMDPSYPAMCLWPHLPTFKACAR